MSKLDAQRALKEAKYAREMAAAEARRKAAGKPAAAPVAPPASGGGDVSTSATKAKSTTAKSAASKGTQRPTSKASPDAGAGTCGHRSMNGRTCTREAGHSEKSHRYS